MGAIEKKEDANCCGTTCKMMMMMMIMATLLDVILLVRIAITVASPWGLGRSLLPIAHYLFLFA